MTSTKSNLATAIVARGPASAGQWQLETVTHRSLKEDEVLVRIVASGICLADVHFGDVSILNGDESPAVYYPRVLGHEGCGYVERVGSAVKHVKSQDPVLLSYASCGKCYACLDGHSAFCIMAFKLNFEAERDVYASPKTCDFTIGGSFFGQSSFASKAVVQERSLINLRGVVHSVVELKLLAPLGCGVQTGSGALIKVGGIQSGQDVAVIGVGSVGLSAIMAAHMCKCNTIIAIDRTESRLELAKSLGATHTINTSSKTIDIKAEVLKATNNAGVHVSLDTTGARILARQSYDYVRNCGKIIEVGLTKPTDTWDVPMIDLMNSGKQILGCVQGDVNPQEYVFEMIKWYREGVFPINKIVAFYEAKDFMHALRDMRSGSTVKPVLVWPSPKGSDSPSPSL